MEALTVTLETAVRLQQADFPQTAKCIWVRRDTAQKNNQWELWDPTGQSDYETGRETARVAAPTAQEIADQLPHPAWVGGGNMEPGLYPIYTAQYWITQDKGTTAYGDTMAEALALLWLRINDGRDGE